MNCVDSTSRPRRSGRYVFRTENCRRYAFPTHVNELVIDRSQAAASEVFLVEIEDGHALPLHRHDDMEQVYYVVEGRGTLTVNGEQHPIQPGDAVLIPASAPHTVTAEGGRVRYLAVDSFLNADAKNEPTWDEHVRVVCEELGWDYDEVVK